MNANRKAKKTGIEFKNGVRRAKADLEKKNIRIFLKVILKIYNY